MKFSSKIQRCGLSPVRKFYPVEKAAVDRGLLVRHLNIGQPDIETPKPFFDAIRNFEKNVVEYAPASGVEIFTDAVQNYYKRLGCDLNKESILPTFGGSEALEIVMSCIAEEGDEILSPEPFYPNYTTFVGITGAKVAPIPTSAAEGYRYASREKIEPLINEHTRGILVANPGNPTGVVLTREEAQTLVDIAREHNLFLISDEVYREIVYAGEISSMLQFPGAEENVVVVDSVSKRFSACGTRVGMLISRNQELMDQALKLCQGRLCAATLEQVGAAAMYNCLDQAYYDGILAEYARRRDAIVSALEKLPGVEFTHPEGAFYFMVTLPVDDTEKFQYFLLEDFSHNGETVMFAPGAGFYSDPALGRNKARVAYVTAPEDLTRAVELLGLGIQAYNQRG